MADEQTGKHPDYVLYRRTGHNDTYHAIQKDDKDGRAVLVLDGWEPVDLKAEPHLARHLPDAPAKPKSESKSEREKG